MNNWAIDIMVRVFANGPGDRGSIPGPVILKTQKIVLDAALFSTQYGKDPGNGVVPFPYSSML